MTNMTRLVCFVIPEFALCEIDLLPRLSLMFLSAQTEIVMIAIYVVFKNSEKVCGSFHRLFFVFVLVFEQVHAF